MISKKDIKILKDLLKFFEDKALINNDVGFASYHNALLNVLNTVEQQRWIPVTERLPELGEIGLIYDKAFGYLTAKYSEVIDDYDEKNTAFLTHYSISSDKWASMHPIAWMPIEPYAEVEDETN